jgi:hypothetical protein
MSTSASRMLVSLSRNEWIDMSDHGRGGVARLMLALVVTGDSLLSRSINGDSVGSSSRVRS